MMYEKYYLEIVSTVQKKTLTDSKVVFAWAQTNTPELYAQERALDEELNTLWGRDAERRVAKGDLEAFKAKVLAWGRLVLMIHKKYKEMTKV